MLRFRDMLLEKGQVLEPARENVEGPFYALKNFRYVKTGFGGHRVPYMGTLIVNDLSLEEEAREYYELSMHLDPEKTEVCDLPLYKLFPIKNISYEDLLVNPLRKDFYHLKRFKAYEDT